MLTSRIKFSGVVIGSLLVIGSLAACAPTTGNTARVDQPVSAAPAVESAPVTTDDQYVDLVALTIPSAATSATVRSAAIDYGHSACDALESGATYAQALAVSEAHSLTHDQAASMIAAATVFYCPDQGAKVGN